MLLELSELDVASSYFFGRRDLRAISRDLTPSRAISRRVARAISHNLGSSRLISAHLARSRAISAHPLRLTSSCRLCTDVVPLAHRLPALGVLINLETCNIEVDSSINPEFATNNFECPQLDAQVRVR